MNSEEEREEEREEEEKIEGLEKEKIIDSLMLEKEDSIISNFSTQYLPTYSEMEIVSIFEEIEDTFNFYNKHIYKHTGLTKSIYLLINSNIILNDITYTLGEYILRKIIQWGRSSYSDQESKLFIFHVIKAMESFDISLFLDDMDKQENGYFDSSLSVKREDIKRIKTEADIISIGMLLKKTDITYSYKEYKNVLAFHPDYLYSDRSGCLFYEDFNKELLGESLELYFEQDVICNFRMSEYKSYLAYLSLIKYFIICDNGISTVYSTFLNSVYSTIE
jgi:hypothetical protein